MTKKIIKRRGNKNIDILDKIYRVDLGIRSEKQMIAYLKKQGYPALAKLVYNVKVAAK